jgi:hypothetical protein
MDYINQVAPDARKITAEMYGKTLNGVLYSEGMDYLQSIVPDVLTTSLFSTQDIREPHKTLYKKLYDNGCFLLCAAGNSGYKTMIFLSEGDLWKTVGACRYDKDKPYRASYSSVGEELDFMSFDDLYSTWDNKRHTGTSYASPLLAGMIGLVQGFFFDMTGKKLTHEKLIEFIRDNSVDLGKFGRDDEYGNGLFVLPNPEDIDVSKYSDMITIEEVFSYLIKEGELLEPDYWKAKIEEENKIKWLFIKWANAVRMARCREKKPISNTDINYTLDKLVELGWLLEPNYWKDKIKKEDKIKWLFFKWLNAIERVK